MATVASSPVIGSRLPLFPAILGGVLALFGTYVVVSTYADPSNLISGLDVGANGVTQAGDMIAGRAASQVLVMVLALALRNTLLLAIAFAMRMTTEALDLVATVRAEGDTTQVIFLVVILCIELAALIVLVRTIRASDRTRSNA